ncbi:odorant receptor 46a-like isoform X1 [Vespula maculifrons]|uniref:Odorant receptor 46a-like isoform X1 n=1 Tax=Vespula maculifrons TaxID=7453 RepID=A0ABD2B468_VESMC
MAYMGKEGKSCAFALKVAQRTDDIMPSKNIDYFQDRYYVFNRRLLTFVGLWPYQESSKRLVRARLINFIVIVPILFQIYMFIVSDLNMESIIELMQIFLPNLCFSICYWNLNYNIMKVKEMLDRINSDWVMLENQRELMIMQKYAKIGRLCTLLSFILQLFFYYSRTYYTIVRIISMILN